MLAVVLFCLVSPLTVSHIASCCGSGISSGRHQPGAERRKRVRALAFHPLAAALELKRALGIVVVEHESGNVCGRVARVRRGRRAGRSPAPAPLPNRVSMRAFGMITASFGPAMDEVDLKNRTGSAGTSIPLSAAWSRKFKPMQTILLGRAIGGPRRTLAGMRGARRAGAREPLRQASADRRRQRTPRRNRAPPRTHRCACRRATARRAARARVTKPYQLHPRELCLTCRNLTSHSGYLKLHLCFLRPWSSVLSAAPVTEAFLTGSRAGP